MNAGGDLLVLLLTPLLAGFLLFCRNLISDG